MTLYNPQRMATKNPLERLQHTGETPSWEDIVDSVRFRLDQPGASSDGARAELLGTVAEMRSSFGLKTPAPLRFELGVQGSIHPHATTLYAPLSVSDIANAITDLEAAQTLGARELNFHLPLETQFESYRNLAAGERFMDLVDTLGTLWGVTPVWENACVLNTKDWSIVENQTYIPANRRLCLDIGHLMLGAKSDQEALARIDRFIAQHGEHTFHLHLHINDRVHDQHRCDPLLVKEFLGQERFARLIAGRSYIFEKGS